MMLFVVDSSNPDLGAIQSAVDAVRGGDLVIFPTETVYGVAADALDESAVRKLMQAKGRMAGHPLPVQISDAGHLTDVASAVSEAARTLAERFWPGPLTLVVAKNGRIPDLVTGGLRSVGVRVPDHPVALRLLREFGGPIVATSANLTGNPAPVDAQSAVSEIGEFAKVVLNSGPCRIGVASTVVDVTVRPARILRLGSLGIEEISAAIGEVDYDQT